jgi:hypothetical protein
MYMHMYMHMYMYRDLGILIKKRTMPTHLYIDMNTYARLYIYVYMNTCLSGSMLGVEKLLILASSRTGHSRKP